MKRQRLDLDDYQSLVAAYHGETDRSAIVLAGSFAEHYLATYLRHYMVEDEDVEKLFERALSSFDARINIAYAFRLISKTQRDDLRHIKDIRNHFAHSPHLIDLQRSEIKRMISKLSIYQKLNEPGVPKEVKKHEKDIYLYAVGIFVVFVHNTIQQSKVINA